MGRNTCKKADFAGVGFGALFGRFTLAAQWSAANLTGPSGFCLHGPSHLATKIASMSEDERDATELAEALRIGGPFYAYLLGMLSAENAAAMRG
jgi:hypothetical protein